MDAVAKLGYRPNPIARSMRSDRSGMIALLVPDLINEYYAVSAEVIHRELTHAGYQLIITSAASAEEEQRTFQWLEAYRVDGIIHVPVDPTQSLPQHTPIVQINRVSAQQIAAVLANEIAAFEDLTRTILDFGHRDIAMISGEEQHSSTRQRLQGVRNALENRNDVRIRVRNGQFTEEWGFEAAMGMLTDLPDVVIASGPRIASGVISALQEHNVGVPEDVSIVSFGDPEWFSLWQPGVASVSPPLEEMAQRAVAKLMQLISAEESDTPAIEYFPCTFVARGSLARRTG